MLIPIALLWNVRIQRQKKIAFIGLFSLSLITIAVAIARTADLNVTKKASGQQDSSYLWMWSAIQSSLGESTLISVMCSDVTETSIQRFWCLVFRRFHSFSRHLPTNPSHSGLQQTHTTSG